MLLILEVTVPDLGRWCVNQNIKPKIVTSIALNKILSCLTLLSARWRFITVIIMLVISEM